MTNNIVIPETVEEVPLETIRVIEGEEEIRISHPGYLFDESKISGGHAEKIFFPKNEQEVATIIKKLNEEKIPVTISAARTGIVGSAVPLYGGVIISFEQLNSVKGIGYDEEEKRWFVRLEPNVTLSELNDIVKLKKFEENQSIPPEKNWVEKFKELNTYYYPIDPTETSAAVGGTIAANASGARSFRYGATREWVRRIRVVIPTGEVLDIPRGKYLAKDGYFIIKTKEGEIKLTIPTYEMPKAKNAAGLYAKPDMDLIDLFIGSEGILGVITEAELWIKEYESHMSNVAFFDKEIDALHFVDLLRKKSTFKPEFIEYFDKNALTLLRNKQEEDPKFVDMPTISKTAEAAISFDLPFDEETIETIISEVGDFLEQCNSSLENTWCGYEERERARFKHFRHAVPEIVNNLIAERKKTYPEIHKLGTDMSVTDEHLVDMMKFYHESLEEAGLEYVIWGHIGDNHVHVNILPRNMEDLEQGKLLYKKFAKKAVEFGGSVSAEHGIGKIKHEYLIIMYGEENVDQMRHVKLSIDPNCILNPGNIFDIEVKK
ncbi:MAG: FAD-binding oxidoreductase [Candidatus Heimdallarchaeum aukensis]|uniref:D-lactate dehydrogenase (cytochrome) n=1 Tax=Candidatus Heimdallarchaeum aukensis TaxID=2876573 RepID=A0A9Y1BK26_9ARCH|nr:MAG: FAD-binding oxidoreductase [Candidatus Heimdallarchaeum aukensis]